MKNTQICLILLLLMMSCNLEVMPDEVVAGSVGTLNCTGSTVSGTLISGQAATNITVSVPYTGGDGGTHSGQTVQSTGVTGLTANLDAGSFDTGSGILDYAVSGTPSAAGIAIFALNIGGKTCSLSVPVQALNGSITGLNCSGATVNGALYMNQAASNVTVTLPYTGGNGGTYGEQTVQSSGVIGLEAKLMSGNFVSGSGNLSYAISGTPSSAGTASFALIIGGINCTVAVPVNVGSIGNLDCQNITLSGTLIAGQAVNSVTVTVPYTGGNGGTHTGQTVNSSTPGVLGLTATLVSGSFSSGGGTLVYTITGTPSTSGSAMFALNIGGIVCTISLTVQAAVGTISAINCSGANFSGTLTAEVTASGVSLSIPYAGGNGGSYNGQTVSSTGVAGLTATLTAGNFATGSASLTYIINGTPTNSGTASFFLNIGGSTCTLDLTVYGRCNAKVSATQTKSFMCHNLGSANSSADPFTPGWEIIGGYWQWGQIFQAIGGPTGPNTTQTNEALVSGWNTTYAPNGAWIDASKTSNDPCPSGFRVPTKEQWDGVRTNNPTSLVGMWTNSTTNYSSGIKFGENLFLPTAGERDFVDGLLTDRGSRGYYWSSSTQSSNIDAVYMYFQTNTISYASGRRTHGRSVRCISE